MKSPNPACRLLASAAIALAFARTPAFAQVPSPTEPVNSPLGAIITNTARGAATVNSAAQNNLYYRGAVCTYNQTAHGGTSSVTFSIQMYDRASNSYQSLVTSGAITADATPTTIAVYPGIAASGPTGYVGFNGHLTRQWRVTETVGGTGTPTVTGTVGCELIP